MCGERVGFLFVTVSKSEALVSLLQCYFQTHQAGDSAMVMKQAHVISREHFQMTAEGGW